MMSKHLPLPMEREPERATRIKSAEEINEEYGLNQRVSMTRVWIQSHPDGKELAPKVMLSVLPAAVGTSRDHDGHGTHVAATAAGSPVAGASYYGLAAGTAKGGSPGSRIAVYRICMPYRCSGSAIMKAFDDALPDGVDIINLSIGQSAGAEFEFSRILWPLEPSML